MSVEVKLPKTSESADESLIVFWHVEEGDSVAEGDTLVEVQTEKAVTEIEAPAGGLVSRILKKRADVAKEGDVLAVILTEDDQQVEVTGKGREESGRPASPAASTSEGQEASAGPGKLKASPRVKKLARDLGVDLAAVIPTGPNGKITAEDVEKAASPGNGAAETEQGMTGNSTYEDKTDRPVRAAPSVRRLSRELGVDLNKIQPSGPDNRATRQDVERYVEQQGTRQGRKPDTMPEQPADKQGSPWGNERHKPMTGIREAIAKAMVHSKQTIPHVTHFGEADVTRLVNHREEMRGNAEEQGIKLTYLAYAVKALVSTLKKFPVLNASVNEEQNKIIYKEYYNIGIAVNTERGLFVPVIHHADQKDLFDLAAEISKLADKARSGKLTAAEMEGGTCSISNIGSAKGGWFTPVINHPEAAILGIGTIEKKPVVREDRIEIAPVMSLSLSYDHRIIDGVAAQEALNELKASLGRFDG
ncbi:2-oxo acid dehydrogenase subunit E2 [Bacillus marinisedimentorum]|uniref:2-oxo acid dehydrogenase subunit E2 n=1 Tax=Bacillus marinisedimentorum TaxID=1821260 RepID=UPI0007E2380D|nr:2-oxo acid dehydrogenase subunit E2 [Bacillus marinisedimentorum]